MDLCHCRIAPTGVDSRTPLQCRALPRDSSPLTSGADLPGPNGRKRARVQRSKWQPQLMRSRDSIMCAVRPPGLPRCLLPPPVNMGGSRYAGNLSGGSPPGTQHGQARFGRARSGTGGATTGRSRPAPPLQDELPGSACDSRSPGEVKSSAGLRVGPART
ncbi:hypothetical protein NDU88_004858 [Pleurodeles waltl]|uniref:Uncharacterized protein n=1 Tax=Pleurodeles waltl TaxID=8319 RepID=A0AAV7VJW8_PLEWA|nr:hypothetical protein NDU88_004858 [Pleurodeles waltl]